MSSGGSLPTIPASSTNSDAVYVKAWQTLGKRLNKLLPPGYRVFAYDPGVLLNRDDGTTVSIPLDIALHLTRKP